MYVPEFVLLTAEGLHVPFIPLVDADGNDGTLPPAQTDAEVPNANVGVMFGFTVTLNAVVVAH